IEDLKKRVKAFSKQSDKAAHFLNESLYGLFQYVSNRIPEISDELYRIDDAMRAGFGWELGPFEYWDVLGAREVLQRMTEAGYEPAAWVEEMLNNGKESFYIVENGNRRYYDIQIKAYKAIPGAENFIILDNLRSNKVVWKNTGATLIDLGDGILNVEFHTKMNTIGGDVIMALNKGIELAEKDFRGMVVSNQGANFSAGAN